ncbi:EAL domain-containing protein [Amphibiibacter pelophylacis]|uniref:EAL domain-containing protein n=1 Tax=Amphibiibacter pelophylacis TaxID=1799477 RepID=A0ACC6NYK2_9BURK
MSALCARPAVLRAPTIRARLRGRWVAAALLALGLGLAGLPNAVRAADPAGFEPAGFVDNLGVVPAGVTRQRGLATDPQGRLWIHSGNGTLQFDGHALVPIQEIYPWMAGKTLPQPSAGGPLGFQIDPQGRLWVAAEDSVVVADPIHKELRTVLKRSLKGGSFALYRQGNAMVIRETGAPHTRLWQVIFGPQLHLSAPLVMPDTDDETRLPVPIGVTPGRIDVLLPALNERIALTSDGRETARAPVTPELAALGPWGNFFTAGSSAILSGKTGDLIWDGQTLQELWPRSTGNATQQSVAYAAQGWIPARGGQLPVLLASISIGEINKDADDGIRSIWFMDRGHVVVTAPTGGMAPLDRNVYWAIDQGTLRRLYLPGGGWHFLRDTNDPMDPKPIVNVDDVGRLVDGDHGLWTGNRGSLTNGLVTHFSSTQPGVARYVQPPPDGPTYTLLSAGPGLACAPAVGKIDCYDSAARRQSYLSVPPTLPGLAGQPVVPTYIDDKAVYASSKTGLIRIDRAGGVWQTARPAPGQPGSLPTGLIWSRNESGASAAVGPTRRLWFGDEDKSLIEWDVQRNTWRRVTLPDSPLLDVGSAPVVLDDQGLWVWLQSRDRLLRYNPTTRELQAIPGLSSQRMRITRSGRGRLWLLADSEVLMLGEDSGALQALDLPAPVLKKLGSRIAAVDGRVYVTTGEGLLSINADAPPLRQAVAPPDLLKIGWVGTDRQPHTARQPPPALELHYTSPLNVRFATRGTLPGDGVQYRYRLRPEGDSSALPWVDLPPDQADASLSSLDPGRYTLEFAARKAWSPWVSSRAPLALDVQPAPWQTAWARLGMALTALLLVGGSLLLLRMRVRVRLTAAQRVAHNLVAHVGEGILLLDSRQRIVLANDATRRLLGRDLSPGNADHHLQDVLDAQASDTPLTPVRIEAALERTGQGRFEMILPPRDAASQEPVMLGASFQRVETEDGQPGCAVVLTDITATKAQERELLHRARYDGLTQLINRSYFGVCLQQAMAEALAQSGAVALIYMDIDHFRDVNDTRGHQAGDALLVALAQRLDQAAPSRARIARFGGDEFAVLLPCSSPQAATNEALAVAHELHSAIRLPWDYDGLRLQPTASSGVAIYPLHAQDPGELYQFADLALYESKRLGRNRTELFNDSLMALAQRRVDLVAALKSAIPRGELRLFLQPKVDAATLRVSGAEALVRWARDGQFVSPADFIPLAEASGLIAPIGCWMQDSVCRWLRQRLDDGQPLVTVSINASSIELETPGFAAQLQELLERYRLPASSVEIEVTESALFRHRDLAIAEMQQLRDMGVAVVADDFGTGYASLSYLTEFPLSGIKIDPTILRSMAQDERRRALVSGLVRNVMALGMSAVAEGVETEAQQELARDLGVSSLQGWLYAKAVPAEHFSATVAAIQPQRPSTVIHPARVQPGA